LKEANWFWQNLRLEIAQNSLFVLKFSLIFIVRLQ